MCWTLCARKNISVNRLLISDEDAFKVWCIFNFLSEDRYPLVIVIEEVSKWQNRVLYQVSIKFNGKYVHTQELFF